MDDEDYPIPTREEWQKAKATASNRAKRHDKNATQAGEQALEACRRLLDEVIEPAPAVATCEHDYQPSKIFARTLQCTLCRQFVETEMAPEPTTEGVPLASYKDLTQ